MRPGRRRAVMGLTLIEILISSVLVAIVLSTATTAFVQMRTLTRRIESRQRLHNSARILYERMTWEMSCLMQGSAFFVVNRAAAAGAPGSVELVFLRGKLDNLDFTLDSNYGGFANCLTDQLWTRWYWDGSRKQVALSANAPARGFTADKDWKAGTYNYKDRSFRNLPTPQRVIIGGSPADTLDADAYGTGATGDIGDYRDLLDRAVPITVNCSDFTVEVVAQDGGTYTTSAAADSSYLANGQFVDGRGGPDLARRPRLVRLRFTLAEPGTGISETFSFSFQPPALLPGH
jgi:hypothetical protein